VLEGLAPVPVTGFHERKVPHNFLAACFFFTAMGAAIYANLSANQAEMAGNSDEIGVLPQKQVSSVNLRDKETGLKLDLSLPSGDLIPVMDPTVSGINSSIENEILLEVKPLESLAIDLPPAATAVAESSPGRMEIRRSAVTPVSAGEGMLAEAGRLYASGELQQADEKIQALLQQDPLHEQARLLYASSLVQRGDRAAASRLLTEGLKLNPGISAWAKIQGSLLADSGRTAEAVDVLTRGMPGVGSDDEYYSLYAALLQRLGRHEEASGIYRLLLEQQTGNGLWWLGLAISLDAMRSVEDALYAYSKALEGQALSRELRSYVQQQIGRLSG
jgi:MSHA biogenesis protein MshN